MKKMVLYPIEPYEPTDDEVDFIVERMEFLADMEIEVDQPVLSKLLECPPFETSKIWRRLAYLIKRK